MQCSAARPGRAAEPSGAPGPKGIARCGRDRVHQHSPLRSRWSRPRGGRSGSNFGTDRRRGPSGARVGARHAAVGYADDVLARRRSGSPDPGGRAPVGRLSVPAARSCGRAYPECASGVGHGLAGRPLCPPEPRLLRHGGLHRPRRPHDPGARAGPARRRRVPGCRDGAGRRRAHRGRRIRRLRHARSSFSAVPSTRSPTRRRSSGSCAPTRCSGSRTT